MAINIRLRESSMVKPARSTPRRTLQISNLDMVGFSSHLRCVHVYRPPNAAAAAHHPLFFDPQVLKHALSKILVPFYPVAGRLRQRDHENNGRFEIDCNDEGVLFVVADCDSVVDDLGDFIPGSSQLQSLVPYVDYSAGISSYPILLVQVTHFKCGGVVIGTGIERIADGNFFFDFMNAWSEMARGLDVIILPTIDRTFLRARNPPRPTFGHIEYKDPPTMKTSLSTGSNNDTKPIVSMFRVTSDQINMLKAKSKEDDVGKYSSINYTTYEILAGHIWRCASKARQLSHDQETKLIVATDGRTRLNSPRPPPRYFGNMIFTAAPTATAKYLILNPLWYAASCVHNALVRMDDAYLRSAIDYLEIQPNLAAVARGARTVRCPNIGITSWITLPIHEADFGWGKPVYVGPAIFRGEGSAFLLPSASTDRSVTVAICLEIQHMKSFAKLFYEPLNIDALKQTAPSSRSLL